MLCCLSCKYHVPFAYLIVSKQVIQRTSETTLHCSRRTHAGSKRYVSGKSDVETLYIYAKKPEFLYDTIDKPCPCGIWSLRVIYLELYPILEVYGVSHHGVSAIRSDLCHYTTVHGSREYIAPIIVSMFSNEIYSAWRMINITSPTIKMLDETASYKFNIHVRFVGLGCRF